MAGSALDARLVRGQLCRSVREQQRGTVRRGAESVEQVQVAITGQGFRHSLSGNAPLTVQLSAQAGVPFGVAHRRCSCEAEVLTKNVGVSYQTQLTAEPLQVGTTMGHPDRIQDILEGLQIRAKPSGGHPGLMDRLDRWVLVVHSQHVLMIQDAIEPVADALPHHIGDRRLRSQGVAVQPEGIHVQGVSEFRAPFIDPGTRVAESFDACLQERDVGLVQLHLDLAEPPAVVGAAVDGYEIIVHLGQEDLPAPLKDQATTDRLQGGHPLEYRSSGDPTHDLVHGVGDELRRSLPLQLHAIERGTRARLGQLQRPRTRAFVFAGSMAEGDPPSPQPEVRGIEVGGHEVLLGQPDRPFDEIPQIREHEPAIRSELHLALGGWLGH